ncbi:hypothetical protein [Bacillus sp. 2205SS5-2]|uniref:hypothetical protein n=1 Tax=Bacillus sp. 2205SS5-2 TaxID=3109031 RepID=UPI00300627E5
MVYETNELLSSAQKLRNMILMIATIAVIIGLIVAFIVARSIEKPISFLNKQVHKIWLVAI